MAINGMLTGISDMYGIFMADKDITGYYWIYDRPHFRRSRILLAILANPPAGLSGAAQFDVTGRISL